jgi:hypothetical protein
LNQQQSSRPIKEYKMSTRYLIAALLMTSACVAQADVLPASASAGQSTFLSGWTTADGTNVVSSGALVGGVSYGSDSANLVKALYDKASASQTGGEVNLSVSQGIEGTYVLGTSNAIMAAMLGNGMSVINTADGKKVLAGSTASAVAPVTASTSTASSGSSTAAPAQTAISVGGTTAVAGGNTGSGSVNTGIGAGVSLDTIIPTAVTPSAPNAAPAVVADATEVPEPSSIALMMAGMMGALALGRRRRR